MSGDGLFPRKVHGSVPPLARPQLRMYAAPMIVASVQARTSFRLSEIAAAMRTATISSSIAQNSVVRGAHRDGPVLSTAHLCSLH
jgi:hypothetical protein